ncbi:uncharacterized protein Bfra_002298 [Botrytis fragariae]|uniref:Uncharacterized protein n=1 Tax=Botrytis fragariae TaxID=1964551 RepID=A0A8H6AYM6_9HELO|nr:uncharacterized protein Bfra_002298 [Botrytis fragariae]KAF5875902.1 hypothetical protein Bfra_002298 [Botrytis fragariae]
MGFHLLQFVDTSVRVSLPSLACSIAGWSGGCFTMQKLRGLQLQPFKELETRIQPQKYGTDFSKSVDTACLPCM